MSTELSAAHFAYANVGNDKSEARVLHEAKKASKKTEIARLKQELLDMDFDFDEHWREEKERRGQLRDDLARAELAKGTPATSILKLLNSRNTVWIYALRNEAKSPGFKPADTHSAPAVEDEGEWKYHDFTGVHSYALNAEFDKLKKHGIIGTPNEGAYFVVSYPELGFLYGDLDFFEATSKKELEKRSLQLWEILNGEYAGKIVTKENPYRTV